MVMKMKRKLIVLSVFVVMILCCAWFVKPDYFQFANAIAYAKDIDVDELYNSTTQNGIRENIDKLIAKNSYTEDDPLLIQNAFGTNTTSLYTYFETEKKAIISYTIHVDDDTIPDFSQTLNKDYGSTHEYQLLGLIPDMKNTITFHITYEDGTKKDVIRTYQMGSLKGKEAIKLEKTEGTSTEEVSEGLYVILGNDSKSDDFMYYYDNNGILRGEVPIEEYRSHRLLFNGDKMYFSYSSTGIAEMNNLGQITATYDLGQYKLHHDYVFDDDGNMLILATDTKKDTVEDMIIKLDLSTKEVTLVSDLGDLFPEYKALVKNNDKDSDWMHINTIQWMGNDEVIISSRETSTIIKLNNIYDNPTVDYMMGESTYWEDSSYQSLLLDKSNSFTSQAGQHSITYVQDDTLEDGQYYLYMFNNNFGYSSTNPDYDWSKVQGLVTDTKDKTAMSKYYKYLVDENKKSYTLVDSFDVPFSAYVSSVQDLENTTVVDSGIKGYYQEYDENHTLIQGFSMDAETYIYRVYKYTFDNFYFNQ